MSIFASDIHKEIEDYGCFIPNCIKRKWPINSDVERNLNSTTLLPDAEESQIQMKLMYMFSAKTNVLFRNEVRLYSIIVILSKSPLQLCLKYPQISTFSTQALNIPQISSYIHIPNSGLPSARQRCWRRRRPRRVEVVGKMWRSGGENEGSIDILDFEYFRYFFHTYLISTFFR